MTQFQDYVGGACTSELRASLAANPEYYTRDVESGIKLSSDGHRRARFLMLLPKVNDSHHMSGKHGIQREAANEAARLKLTSRYLPDKRTLLSRRWRIRSQALQSPPNHHIRSHSPSLVNLEVSAPFDHRFRAALSPPGIIFTISPYTPHSSIKRHQNKDIILLPPSRICIFAPILAGARRGGT